MIIITANKIKEEGLFFVVYLPIFLQFLFFFFQSIFSLQMTFFELKMEKKSKVFLQQNQKPSQIKPKEPLKMEEIKNNVNEGRGFGK